MKVIGLQILLSTFCFYCCAQNNEDPLTLGHTQNSVNATGGNIRSSSGSLNYSIGQVFYGIESESTPWIVQGIQQPITTDSLATFTHEFIEVQTYPNPVTSYLIIDLTNFEGEPSSYELFNTGGSILKTQEIMTKATKIPMDFLSAGIYLIRVYSLSGVSKTIKLIKL